MKTSEPIDLATPHRTQFSDFPPSIDPTFARLLSGGQDLKIP
jgi:hypothetical protein